jgi:hypothetical protein
MITADPFAHKSSSSYRLETPKMFFISSHNFGFIIVGVENADYLVFL